MPRPRSMILPDSPFRSRVPRTHTLQSRQFLSPLAVSPSSPITPAPPLKPHSAAAGRPFVTGTIGSSSAVREWAGRSQLLAWLERFSPLFAPPHLLPKVPALSPFASHVLRTRSPFLRYSGKAGPSVAGGKGRLTVRPPRMGQKERDRLCAEAYFWRCHRVAFPSAPGWGGVPKDPVPEIVRLLGGESRLGKKERDLLGLRPAYGPSSGAALEAVAKQVRPAPPPSLVAEDPAPLKSLLPPFRIPTHRIHATGNGRGAVFKGRLRDRQAGKRAELVRSKMEGMEKRVEEYRQEVREFKKKGKLGLPF